jgi:hypothetical protein
LDEPLTPTNITLRDASSQGSASIQGIKIDKRGIIVQRSTHKLYALTYNPYNQDYDAENIMRVNEDIGYPDNPAFTTGFIDLAVQRQPETYIWGIRSDGVAVCVLFEPSEKVQAFFRITTGTGRFSIDAAGVRPDNILQIVVLPQSGEDSVYALVERQQPVIPERPLSIFSIEKFRPHYETSTRAWDSANLVQQTAPGLHQVDAYVVATPSSVNVVSGLTHLNGRTVMALGYSATRSAYGPIRGMDGSPYFTVDSNGTITLGEDTTGDVRVGVPYYGNYKSAKLAHGANPGGTALLQPKKVNGVGLLLQDTHPDAIWIGSDFNGIESMDPLPRIEDLAPVATKDFLPRVYDKRMFPFSNSWDTDARICIQVQPGYSATLSGIVMELDTSDRT